MGEPSQNEIKKRIQEKQKVVTSWEDFHRTISRMTDTAWIFRGVASPSHLPIPSIGRENGTSYKKAQEIRLFETFKKSAAGLITDPRFDDWYLLAFAQHIGVPTRLMDWSLSPLVAAFFALESDGEEDRLIYCLKYSSYIHEVETITLSPFDNTKEGRFSPPLMFDRIRAQRGVFTIHPDPTKIFYHDKMRVIRIRHEDVKKFRKRLFKYGIDYWYIYPDTEGLGLQLRWQFKNRVGLGSRSMDKKRTITIRPNRF